MNTLKIKKGPILLPLLILLVGLSVYTFFSFRGVSAADSISLGQQYLNEMNYDGAVSAFAEAMERDPNSKDARIGLAQAYAGTEEYNFAQELLSDMVYVQHPNEEASKVLIDIMNGSGQEHQAISVVEDLIQTTDKEEYYELREELLTERYGDTRRSLAVGVDHTMIIRDGAVFARGSNTLGQLGIAPSSEVTEAFVSANFAGTPIKVACVGRTSLVIDANGDLWAAGENRWGQMGEGYATTDPQAGWSQIPCVLPVVDVTGTPGRLLVLMNDGSLWSAGAGSQQTLQRMSSFPVVLEIAANQRKAAVLTSGGQLYTSDSTTPDVWTLAAENVSTFTLSEDSLCWIGERNTIGTDYWNLSVPDDWYNGSDVVAQIPVRSVASADGITLFTANGVLYHLPGDGSIKEVPSSTPVVTLYSESDVLVVEHEDGSVSYWNYETNMLKPIETF